MQPFLKKYGVLLIMFIIAWRAFGYYRHIGPDNQALRADGKGYYAYLPALFIYHDNQFNFIDYYEHKYNNPPSYADFRTKIQGVYVNKYYVGVAILQLPFFLLAHTISYIFYLPMDGYAPLYQQFFVLGGLFYLFIGMQAFLLYLMAWKITVWQALFVIVCITLGTNCYHYSVYEQCMSHIYSLSMICIFIYGVYRVIHTQSKKWLAITLFVLGMIVILRPINVVIITFIPFIAGNWPNLKKGISFLFKNYRYLLIGIAAALIPFLVQSLFWYWQTGKFIVYSYGTESMEWANPKMVHILFGYRKGWFIWTPLAFVGICGLLLFINDLYRFISISLFIALVIYILSCWWNPDYGMGFGAREFIEYLFVPGIGLALLIKKCRSSLARFGLILVCCLCIYINQVQAFQYRKSIILWDGMDKADYWRVFLRTSPGYYDWLDERDHFKPPVLINSNIDKSFTNSFERPGSWPGDDYVSNKMAKTGFRSNLVDKSHNFSATFKYHITNTDILQDSMVQASVWFYGPQPDDTRLVINFGDKGKMLSWNDVRLRNFVDNNFTWTRAILQVAIPKNIYPGETLTCMVYDGSSNELFYLDDFRVDLIKKHNAF